LHRAPLCDGLVNVATQHREALSTSKSASSACLADPSRSTVYSANCRSALSTDLLERPPGTSCPPRTWKVLMSALPFLSVDMAHRSGVSLGGDSCSSEVSSQPGDHDGPSEWRVLTRRLLRARAWSGTEGRRRWRARTFKLDSGRAAVYGSYVELVWGGPDRFCSSAGQAGVFFQDVKGVPPLPSEDDLRIWDVDRLVELARNLPVEEVPISEIWGLDGVRWFVDEWHSPTCRAALEHPRLVLDTDPAYPILLEQDKRVVDGMHRVHRREAVLARPRVRQRRSRPQGSHGHGPPDKNWT